MKNPSLVIMAAGMGSRYGGLKQIEAIDSYGHTIIDYSIFDAIEAGFSHVVFVIKKEIDKDFREVMEPHLAGKNIKVDYVYQELDKIPDGFTIPEERKKPLGTAHAILCCKGTVDGPFAVINADDYYGKEAFRLIYKFLTELPENSRDSYAMIGYRIGNTISPNGGVSRGICRSDECGNLTEIIERKSIYPEGEKIYFDTEDGREELSPDALVSMNFWGFDKSFIDSLSERFPDFLKHDLPQNPERAEFSLPIEVADMIEKNECSVKVLETHDRWHGVTCREDHGIVVKAFANLLKEKAYPEKF
ncbi:MAG: nucleotidyltransferase [Clostridia bacterium]|nr:nucleotidyltransferase [Clostridia bacterium]